jgi:hypothetical protein
MEPAQELLLSATQARRLVSVILSQIGVNLTWHTGLSDCDDLPGESVRTAFKIRWAHHAPYTLPAGTLAAARPFGSSGSAITLYQVPLRHFLKQHANAPEVVLEYVLAHELAHVMQGLDRHSASGILKANWSYREYFMMLSRTPTFSAEDVDLIRARLETKRSNIASRERAPQSQHVVQATQARLGEARIPGTAPAWQPSRNLWRRDSQRWQNSTGNRRLRVYEEYPAKASGEELRTSC